jgi:hypothetical protein
MWRLSLDDWKSEYLLILSDFIIRETSRFIELDRIASNMIGVA